MYINKSNEVDETKHEIFGVHTVCSGIKLINHCFFFLALSILKIFLIWGCTFEHGHKDNSSCITHNLPLLAAVATQPDTDIIKGCVPFLKNFMDQLNCLPSKCQDGH